MPILLDNGSFRPETLLLIAGRTYVDLSNCSEDQWDEKLEELIKYIKDELQKIDKSQSMLPIKSNQHMDRPIKSTVSSQLKTWLEIDTEQESKITDEISLLYRKRLEGTRTWLLDPKVGDLYKAANATGVDSQVFWLSAVAGAGKSIIAVSFLKGLEASNTLGGYFLCKYSDEYRNKPTNLIRSLAYQLAARFPKIIGPKLDTLCEQEPDVCRKSSVLTLFDKLIKGPCQGLPEDTSPVVIVIDALDECGQKHDASTNQLLTVLSEWKKSLPPCIKLFLTSRPNDNILQGLKGPLEPVELVITEDQNLQDIAAFAKDRMLNAQLVSRMRHSTQEVGEMARKLAVEAQGLFIWISLR